MLFEVAIIQKPTKKEIEEGTATEQLLFGPKAIVASNAQNAAIAAMMSPEAPKGLDFNRAEVLVRPFQ